MESLSRETSEGGMHKGRGQALYLVLDQFLTTIYNVVVAFGITSSNVPCLEPFIRGDGVLG